MIYSISIVILIKFVKYPLIFVNFGERKAPPFGVGDYTYGNCSALISSASVWGMCPSEPFLHHHAAFFKKSAQNLE